MAGVLGLDSAIQYLRGVGPKMAALLAKLDISTIYDLLNHLPRTYINRSVNTRVADLRPDTSAALVLNVHSVDRVRTNRGRERLEVVLSDNSGYLACTWFSSYPGQEKALVPGAQVWVSGLISEFHSRLQMVHPELELLDEDKDDFWHDRPLVPIYPLTAGISQKYLRRLIRLAWESCGSSLTEFLPTALLARHQLVLRHDAYEVLHFATDQRQILPARRRLVLEEFFLYQIMLFRCRGLQQSQDKTLVFEHKKQLTYQLYKNLPFRFTAAQARVVKEIIADMTSSRRTNRLIQGDVGSGKTVVILVAMLLAVENGYQAALLAPTEILAEQHRHTLARLLQGLPAVKLALLKGGNYKGRAQVLKDIADGTANLVVGTHALIQKGVEFHRLGLAVIDEQHRFGVEQRAAFCRDSRQPELLYLSATPIPRSLALTVYGDLDVSVLDELPPGRTPVATYFIPNSQLPMVYRQMETALAAGGQAYVVCPLIEESAKVDLRDAYSTLEEIQRVFPDYAAGLLHGRMKTDEKDEVMRDFSSGELRILVSTTVIEVGVDVPNASFMLVEQAERFGLAQLHQLRGRVGRGRRESFCYLVAHYPLSEDGRQRLETMARTNNGFEIAQKDLELRGAGDFFGTAQTGRIPFKHGDIIRDADLLALAREEARTLVESDRELASEALAPLRHIYRQLYTNREELFNY